MFKKNKKIELSINSNEKLSNDPLFKYTLGFSFALFIGLIVVLFLYNDLKFCPTPDGYAKALDIFKLPTSILTFGLTLAGFRAVVFRSNQTKKQIDLSIEQQVFKNYIDHKKEFMNVLSALENTHNIKIKGQLYLYEKIFPLNSPVRVEFRTSDANKEEILWLSAQFKNYNQFIKGYNDLGVGLNRGEFSEKPLPRPLLRLLAEYCVLLHGLSIDFKENSVIKYEYKGYFFDNEKLNILPTKFEMSVFVLRDYLLRISNYSLPSESIELAMPVSYSGGLDSALSLQLYNLHT